MSTIKPEHFKTIAVTELMEPTSGGVFQLYRDYWWLMDANDHALIYIGPDKRSNSPQCNASEAMVRRFADSHQQVLGRPLYPVKLARAFYPIKISDYA